MPRPRDQKKVAAVHAAAIRLVIQQGFTGLKMADVAQEAGLATGTVYIYYPSKEALINAIYTEIKREMLELYADFPIAGQSYPEQFKELWIRYFRYCLDAPDKMFFVEQFQHSGLIQSEVLEALHRDSVMLDNFLLAGFTEGHLTDHGIPLMKAFILGSAHEWVRHFVRQRIKPGPTTLERCFSMVWNALSSSNNLKP
ncbi:MAG: TetR/AcrR family transcriptional regulator [Bacteroidota bacterium]|nr:TetR/AcrR family transcriptional regulator [Bacteroidota bacterium]MDX5430180.1 TetR/AcrR family transcriptional regulator [Bacteroidota bacterium]MDX5468943.1 TetR/AcrR family transcriptional regulator [Bacteroidota bacterium]